MMGRSLSIGFALLFAGIVCLAQAQSPLPGFPPGAFSNKAAIDPASGGGGGGCADSATFLARVSLDASHTTAYQNYICGLNTDSIGIFSGAFDVLEILGTQNTASALVNLVATGFGGTAFGTPTFTTDRGYLGVDSSTTVYIDTGFNPTSASSPNYVRNSSHVSVWSNTTTGSSSAGGAAIGTALTGAGTIIIPKYSDGATYFGINQATQGGVTAVTAQGHFIASRTGASTWVGYLNGSSVVSSSEASTAVNNLNIIVLATNQVAVGANFGAGLQISMFSIGRGLTSTESGNLYTRTRTLGTALGWP